MSHQLSTARPRLMNAREKLSEVFTTLDDASQELGEPERGACLELRGQVGDLVRRLGNLTAFLGGPAR